MEQRLRTLGGVTKGTSGGPMQVREVSLHPTNQAASWARRGPQGRSLRRPSQS